VSSKENFAVSEYGISKRRFDDLRELAATHLGVIGVSTEEFLQEISQLRVDYLGEPIIVYSGLHRNDQEQMINFEEV
jgi:hypothetical protein